MATQSADFDPEYLDFVRLFNQGEYDESHQVLTGAWQRNMSYRFYKGLIQLAGAFEHWRAGSYFWAEDLFASAHNLLESYAPMHEGLDVEQLLSQIRSCNEIARRAKESGGELKNALPEVRLELNA